MRNKVGRPPQGGSSRNRRIHDRVWEAVDVLASIPIRKSAKVTMIVEWEEGREERFIHSIPAVPKSIA